MGPLGELGALFNPGMRHEIEERASKANRREEEGNARDGDLRIDLASGVAVINVPGKSGPAAESAAKADEVQNAEKVRKATPAPTRRATAPGTKAVGVKQAGTGRRPARDGASEGESAKPRTGVVPSSKASRAAR